MSAAPRYVAERVAGLWQVRDTVGCDSHGEACIVVYGPGSSGAAAAKAGAARLNKTNVAKPANEVRAWRTARGLSQVKLAELLGVPWLRVQRWEAGTHAVPAFLHLALAELARQTTPANADLNSEH